MKRSLVYLIGVVCLVVNLFAGEYKDYVDTNCNQVINKEKFDLCYSYDFKGPVFGKTIIDGSKINIGVTKRPNFKEEQEIPDDKVVKVSDYKGQGKIYNIGHAIATDADFDYDKVLLKETYSLANTIPQAAKFNQQSWLKLERLGRDLSKQFGLIESWTIVDYRNKTVSGKLIVPNTMYRIYNKPGVFMACFKYENNDNFNNKLDTLNDHKISCDNFKELDDYTFEQ